MSCSCRRRRDECPALWLARKDFLLGQAYGADFVYDEMRVTGPGARGEQIVSAVAATG